jgi:enoyl-CoA hydratase/carnithine racemase
MDSIVQHGQDRAGRLRPAGQIGFDFPGEQAGVDKLFPTPRRQILFLSRLTNINTVVIRKISPGFSDLCVRTLDKIFNEIEAGRLGELKFVVFDFAHAPGSAELYGKGVERLMDRLIDLVVASPVITVAWARGPMHGADLEFALRCSALLADSAAQFSFDCEPERIGRLYGVLTRRLGLVRTERLLEAGETLDAPTMHELCLVKELVDTHDGLAAIETYLLCYARRYNGNLAILRAQRLAEKALAESSASLRSRRAGGGATRPPQRAAKSAGGAERSRESNAAPVERQEFR